MSDKPKPPSVRMVRAGGRPIQLRYTSRETGKEVRLSTGTYDPEIAAEQKKELEAKLLLGLPASKRRKITGPNMLWEDFRERYTALQLATLREKSAIDAESRLDIAERIVRPRLLCDLANSEVLHDLQQKLLAGAESRFKRPRSAITTHNYMATILAALSWAVYMEWLPAVPRVRKIKTAKLRQMKGRPITLEEFERMIKATDAVVGTAAAPTWRYVLRGLWESGLRLGELLRVHWTNQAYIVPAWPDGEYPILTIPAAMQKNDTEESIPLLPGFAKLLRQTPEDQRSGFAFDPLSMQRKAGRELSRDRIGVEWVGKVITKIGTKAKVVVVPKEGERKAKFASAHDLRRSCADRLAAAGVSEREVSAIMRHASVETTRRHYTPGNSQRTAKAIYDRLGVPGNTFGKTKRSRAK
jgi:integrase